MTQRHDPARFLHGYLLLDALSIVLAFLVSYLLTGVIDRIFLHHPFYYETRMHLAALRLGQFVLITAAVLLNFERLGHYKLRIPFWIETRGIIVTLGLAMLVDGFLLFASKHDFSRVSLILAWALAVPLIIVSHEAFRIMLRGFGLWRVPVLLVGSGPTAAGVRAAVKSEASLGYAIAVQIRDLPSAFRDAGESWERLCAQYDADYVLVALDGPELARAEEPLAQLMREKVPFSLAPPLRQIPVQGMVAQYFLNHDVLLLTRYKGLEQPLPRIIKRAFDIVVSGTALLLLSPFMLLCACLIRRDGGPALYGHTRIGQNGKPFTCLKFRSMIINSEEVLRRHLAANPEAAAEWEREWKLRDDPRITPFGRFIRRTSIDELPQLFNVLRGHMSLVGPRPIVREEKSRYSGDIAYYYDVRPGITGLWQVSGRNDVSYEKRVRIDAWYVRNWSLWNDIAILCKTLPALILRRGAY